MWLADNLKRERSPLWEIFEVPQSTFVQLLFVCCIGIPSSINGAALVFLLVQVVRAQFSGSTKPILHDVLCHFPQSAVNLTNWWRINGTVSLGWTEMAFSSLSHSRSFARSFPCVAHRHLHAGWALCKPRWSILPDSEGYVEHSICRVMPGSKRDHEALIRGPAADPRVLRTMQPSQARRRAGYANTSYFPSLQLR